MLFTTIRFRSAAAWVLHHHAAFQKRNQRLVGAPSTLLLLGRQQARLLHQVAQSPSSGTRPTTFLASTTTSSSAEEGAIKVPRKFVPYPFEYHQVLDCTVESITNRGLGIARVSVPPREEEGDEDDEKKEEDAETSTNKKWVIMVPSVIPGETVRVRIFRNFKNYSEADLVEVVEPSKDRIEPVCALAGECGGCQLQHMNINLQREWKTKFVEDALEQYDISSIDGETVPVTPCLGTSHIFGYRSKITPHYQHPSKSRRGKSNVDAEQGKKMITAIGFQRQSARQTIDVPACPIATPAVNAAYRTVREQLLSQPIQSRKGATLLFRQANLDDEYVETNHKASMTTTVKGLDLTYRAGNFFQNNYYVLPIMVEQVVEQATASTTSDDQRTKMTHLADCYCGSGLFALSASPHFERVVGIEINDMAITEATANADANGITNCEFKAASAENIFSAIADFPRDTTVVVLDPPRKGCSTDFLEQLYQFAPRRIVYMSCDPTTQARDAAGMVAAGYTILSVQPYDLFPQTRHIECLMVLERRS